MIVDVSLTTTEQEDLTGSPVSIRLYGGVPSLYFEDSNHFAAIVNSSALGKIQNLYSARLVATLQPKPYHDDERGKKPKGSDASGSKWKIQESTARITIYAKIQDKDAIADILSDEELFLQHPMLEEYEPEVPYFNPHFLLRPGAEMPKIEELSISDSPSAAGKGDVLDEVNRGKIWRIFDLANGVGASASVVASKRLKSALRGYVNWIDHCITQGTNI